MLIRRGVIMAVVCAGAAVAGLSMLKANANGAPGLANTAWVLEEMNGAALPEMPEGMARTPGIQFGADGQFSATAGCNMMNGTAEINGAAISFPDQMAATMMACPPPLDELERGMGEAMAEAGEIRVEDSRMLLLNGAGAVVLTFSAAP